MADQNPNIDFSEFLKMAQNMTKNQEPFNPPTLAPIDQAINSQKMRILKASLPYFDYNQQKNLAMTIKLLEFRRTIDVFKESTPIHNDLQQKKSVTPLEFLSDIKNSCDEPHQKKLNMLIMLMNMQNTMENAKNNPKLLNPLTEPLAQGNPIPTTPTPKANTEETSDSYSDFMNMVNKIIEEKDGE